RRRAPAPASTRPTSRSQTPPGARRPLPREARPQANRGRAPHPPRAPLQRAPRVSRRPCRDPPGGVDWTSYERGAQARSERSPLRRHAAPSWQRVRSVVGAVARTPLQPGRRRALLPCRKGILMSRALASIAAVFVLAVVGHAVAADPPTPADKPADKPA